MHPAVPEPEVLRALGHPTRRAILERLARGRASGAELARALGSNTGVMSYHLRQLGAAGLVELDETRGRAQFWRLSEVEVRFRDPQQTPDHDAARSAVDHRLATLAGSIDHYVTRTDLPPAWREAALFAQSTLELDEAELAELTTAYEELLSRWARPTRATRPGTRAVRVNFFAFPDDLPDDTHHSTRQDPDDHA